ncbi:hypothetical protein MNBD_DELTA02-215 [hydrothermal vent metagenome]|uniref:Uncharacterized protein n=1 Tax=hydrothermal vent metagenome TaxID=652676 RepID=A0A3B0VQ37_9ZZZZ
MSDFFDKALLLGAGLEKKLKELACELESTGRENRKGSDSEDSGADADGLGAKERIENKLVTEGVRGVKELVSLIKDGKDKVDGEVSWITDSVADRLGLATASELASVKEMARVAREEADASTKNLEKATRRLKKLEKRLTELEKED